MFLRPYFRRRHGQREAYWALVESFRTERGPRQRTVAYLGLMDEAGRLGVEQAADPQPSSPQPSSPQRELFPEPSAELRFVEIDRASVRVENCRQFGGPWLALELVKQLGLHEFLKQTLPAGQEHIPWSLTALILVIGRLCEPSSELHIAENFYRHSALADLLGVPVDKVDDNRLYRGLDALLPHKEALEKFLKQRFGELFAVEYDLLLYDVTSTYFEGQANANASAKRGYRAIIAPTASKFASAWWSRVVDCRWATRCSPEIGTIRRRCRRSSRRWNRQATAEPQAHLGVGSWHGLGGQSRLLPKRGSGSTSWEHQKRSAQKIRTAIGVARLARDPRRLGGQVVPRARMAAKKPTFFVADRDRREKEQAMHARFEKRIEEGLTKIAAGCSKRAQAVGPIERRVGRLLGDQNTREHAGLFDVQIQADTNGRAGCLEEGREVGCAWAQLSEGLVCAAPT